MSATARQARAKQLLLDKGGKRLAINLPASSIDDLERVKSGRKAPNNSAAIIDALRWYARIKL